MFRVFLNQLAYCCEELEQTAVRQRNEIQNIDDIIRTLHSLSGMEHVIGVLRKKREELRQQQQEMLNMLQGLEKIRLCYLKTEQRITENCEDYRYFKKYAYEVTNMRFFDKNIVNPIPISID